MLGIILEYGTTFEAFKDLVQRDALFYHFPLCMLSNPEAPRSCLAPDLGEHGVEIRPITLAFSHSLRASVLAGPD